MTYGKTYQKLTARIEANRRDPSKIVAFIGTQLCFLERTSTVPAVGKEVEVMITRAVYGKYPEGHDWAGRTDTSKLTALMVEVVDPTRHALIAIDGFECIGSMCRTTAHGRETNGTRPLTSEEIYPAKRPGETASAWSKRTTGSIWLTPGRCDVFVAENVNASFNKREPTPRRPMNVWVERASMKTSPVRVAGLSSLDDAIWSPLVRRPREQQRAAA